MPALAEEALEIDGFCSVEVKEFGPVQLYVAPETAGVERLIVVPVHTGELLLTVGVAGSALTTTVVVPAALAHPATVRVTEYVPAIAVVALVILGFCRVEVNELGPVQLYVAPDKVGVVRLIVDPAHTGELLPAVGVEGTEFTTTVVLPAKLVQPDTVTVTEYVPALAAAALLMVGFCDVDVNELGPVQL